MADTDDVVLILEDCDEPARVDAPRWKIMVVDDEPAVHDGTRYALSDYALNGRGLEIVSAYSAEEARILLREHPDTAVVLLDVIMETDAAGLDLVGFIRDELENETIRIILRTGQPGQAPERRIIVDYDINDYKAKTELTADKLFTSLTAALRGWQQLQRMTTTQRGLEIILDAAATLYDPKSTRRLAECVLVQLASLLDVACDGVVVFHDAARAGPPAVLAGAGSHADAWSGGIAGLDPDLRRLVDEALEVGRHRFTADCSAIHIRTAGDREIVVALHLARELADGERTLVDLFTSKVSIAFDNVVLYEQLHEANALLEERVEQRTRELTAANRRLAAQWVRLQRANAFKSEVLGTVAHDLRNPLSVIIGRAELLERMVDSPTMNAQAAKSQLGHMHAAADRLAGMVESLITDAMTDALDISIKRDAIDLGMLVAEVVEGNQPLAAKKSQTIALSVVPGPPIPCDADRMREAIDNLLSNAVKYSPIGGRIEVVMAYDAQDARILVADHGPGLTAEDLSRLYGRFQRLSAKPTAGESSIGLGLSIVKRIVDLHGGTITATSDGRGYGATFTLTLPLVPSDDASPQP